jgi:hypothetical protein
VGASGACGGSSKRKDQRIRKRGKTGRIRFANKIFIIKVVSFNF